MGYEPTARFGSFVLAALLLALLFVGISLWPQVQWEFLRPPSYDGWQSQLFLFINLTLGNVETAALLFLFPAVNQNKRSVFWKWSLLSVVTLAAIFLFTAVALGDYAKSQRFPFYTVTKIAEVSIFQRLDSLSCGSLGVYHVGSSGFIFRGIRKIPGTDDAEKSIKICSSRLRGTAAVLSGILTEKPDVLEALGNFLPAAFRCFCLSVLLPLLLLLSCRKGGTGDEKNIHSGAVSSSDSIFGLHEVGSAE